MTAAAPAEDSSDYGLCKCGCGQATAIAKRTDRRHGHIAGTPQAFVKGHSIRPPKKEVGPCQAAGCSKPTRHSTARYCGMHASRLLRNGSLDNPRRTALDRFFAFVEQDGDCWIWKGVSVRGYGYFRGDKPGQRAHRFAYEQLRTEIPDGLQLDHLCRRPACVNPWHLEPVTARVNLLRSTSHVAQIALGTACPNGHEYTEANTRITPQGQRECRACARALQQRYRARKRAKS